MEGTRYFIKISYQGTRYHGWQVQPNALTIQEILETDLGLLLGEKIKLTGCGRTDTGVHAREFYAHFDSGERALGSDSKFLFRINSKLPPDIVIHQIIPVLPDAHARFSAVSRTYEYHIRRTKQAFGRELAHFIYGDLDVEAMQQSCAILTGYHDFTSFSRVDTDSITNDCRIERAEWKDEGEMLVFAITADRFLRNMVRAVVGTVLDIGMGKLDLAGFRKIVESRDRSAAGTSAPAKGLFLTHVAYLPEIFL